MMKQLLIQTNGNNLPWSIGYAPFLVGQQIGQNKLVVSVKCRIGSLPSPYFALLDTGAEWSVIGGEIAKILEDELGQPLDYFDMHTRFGEISGSLFRLDISLLAEENAGYDLTVESTVFVSKDWDKVSIQ